LTQIKEQAPTSEELEKLEADLKRAVERARLALSRRQVYKPNEIPSPDPMSPKNILRLRQEFNFSQEVFARFLNVSVNTVQAWEQGTRVPSGAALKLLSIVKRHPHVLLEVVAS